MKKYVFFTGILFSSLFVHAQFGGIELPKIEGHTTIPENRFFHNFCIMENQQLFSNDEKLTFWNQVGSSILRTERSSLNKFYSGIIINANTNTPFSFIERLLNEILSAWSGLIYYKVLSKSKNKAVMIETYGRNLKEHVEINNGIARVIMEERIDKMTAPPEIPFPPVSYTQFWGNIFHDLKTKSIKNLLPFMRISNLNFLKVHKPYIIFGKKD